MKLTLTHACLWGSLFAAPWMATAADAPTNILIQVEATAMTDAIAPPIQRGSAPAFIAGVPGVAVRSQGYAEPQADLSIRGAPFSSCGLLLSGLSLHNPQTEHFQADLPVPYDVFGAPQLLTGIEQFRLSSGHPAGSVALDFAPLEDLRRIEIGGGNGDQFVNLRLSRTDTTDDHLTVGEGAFAEAASVDRTDGFDDNYLNRWSAGAQGQVRGGGNAFDLLGAYGWRAFGATGFYGTSSLYPAEEQVAESMITAAGTIGSDRPDGTPSHITAGWQQTADQYWLDRTDHGRYANHTLTDTASLHGDTRQGLGKNLDLDLRADATQEWIDGTHSGTITPGYTGLGTQKRGTFAAGAVPRYTMGDWVFSAGGAAELFSDDRAAWLPAAGIEWHPTTNRTISLSYTEAVREPSYT